MAVVPAAVWDGQSSTTCPAQYYGTLTSGQVKVIDGWPYVSPLDSPSFTGGSELGSLNTFGGLYTMQSDAAYGNGQPVLYNTTSGYVTTVPVAGITVPFGIIMGISNLGDGGPTGQGYCLVWHNPCAAGYNGAAQGVPGATATYAINAGGTAIGNAAALNYGLTIVTGANNSAAVKLPVAIPGAALTVKSVTSGSTLQVFPQVNCAINELANNAVYNMANLSIRIFHAYNSALWVTDEQTIT
jgi:hypothetical protein